MAAPLSLPNFFSECFQASKTHEQREEEQRAFERCKNKMSALPLEKGWPPIPLRKFKGFWLPGVSFLPGFMAFSDHLQLRPSDVLLASHPKSGTVWLKALAFATMHRDGDNYPLSTDHPLRQRHAFDCAAQLEELFATGQIPDLDALPPPRLLSTHIPYSMLPESVKNAECKIVYICRDPKDTLVSLWYFMDGMRQGTSEPITLDNAFELFCNGVSLFGPVWDHQLEYWLESLRRPQKVLFLKYEDIKAEPVKSLTMLAEFISRPFSEEEKREGVVDEIVKLCSFEKLSSLAPNKEGVRLKKEGEFALKNALFFRNGKVGDWKNNLTPQMAQRLDEITKQKFHGSGLSFADVVGKDLALSSLPLAP